MKNFITVAVFCFVLLGSLACADDSDNARLQKLEDSVQEELANKSARVAPTKESEATELSEEERSDKYQLAKNIENNWMVYAKSEASRILNPNLRTSGSSYHPEKDMYDALGLYLEVARTEVVAIDDVVRISRYILEGDPIEKAYEQFAARQLRQRNEPKIVSSNRDRDNAIDSLVKFYAKAKSDKIKVVLMNAVIVYKQELRVAGFNSELRYRSAIDLPWDDARRKVTHCGMHVKHLDILAELTATLGTEDQKTWAIHAVDVSISDFCCDCSGEVYYNELANKVAYEQYMKLGDNATAKKVALELAKQSLHLYANGWEPDTSYTPNREERPLLIPVLLSIHKIEAETWFSRAGWDNGTMKNVIADELQSAAKRKEEEKRYYEARDIYRLIGDQARARKMELLTGPNNNR